MMMRKERLYKRGREDKRILQWEAILILNKQQNCWGNNNNKIRDRKRNPYLLNMIQDYPFFLSKSKG
jgi:hypothetical protein